MAPEPDTLEFRYTFAPRDDELAFAEHNRSIRLRASLQAICGLALVGILVVSFVAAPSFTGWRLLVSVAQIAAAALLLGYVTGPVLKAAVSGVHHMGTFAPIECETSVSKEGIRNTNAIVKQEAGWPAVRRIVLKLYGIHFDAGPTWYISRSAFASNAEMRSAYARIKDAMKIHTKQPA